MHGVCVRVLSHLADQTGVCRLGRAPHSQVALGQGTAADVRSIAILRTEINVMRTLNHPHIVHYLGCELSDPTTFTVFMESVLPRERAHRRQGLALSVCFSVCMFVCAVFAKGRSSCSEDRAESLPGRMSGCH